MGRVTASQRLITVSDHPVLVEEDDPSPKTRRAVTVAELIGAPLPPTVVRALKWQIGLLLLLWLGQLACWWVGGS